MALLRLGGRRGRRVLRARGRRPRGRRARAHPPSAPPVPRRARFRRRHVRRARVRAVTRDSRFYAFDLFMWTPFNVRGDYVRDPPENVLRAKTTTAEFMYPQWLRAPLLSDPRRVADPTDAHLMLMTDSMVDVSPFIAKFVWHATHPEKTPTAGTASTSGGGASTATRRAANSSPRRRNASRRSATRSRTPARPSRGGRTSFPPSGCSRATTWRPSCDCARRFGRRRTTAR